MENPDILLVHLEQALNWLMFSLFLVLAWIKRHPLLFILLRSLWKKYRVRLGWSQEEVAAALGVDVGTLRKWENGRSNPRPKNVEALTRFYQNRLDDPPQRTYGQMLRSARMGAKLTQHQFANQLGSDARTIKDWERGTHKPNARSRKAISDFFGKEF